MAFSEKEDRSGQHRRARVVADNHCKNSNQARDSLNTQTLSKEAFYHRYKPFEMKKNQASLNEELQCKHGLLPPKILNTFQMALLVHPARLKRGN